MKKIEQITHQEQQKLGITFEQAQEYLRDASCDLVASKPAPNYETYRRASEFFQKTDGPEASWTFIEGPQGPSGVFLVCSLDKQTIINRLQAKLQQSQKEEQPRERARA